MKNQYLIIFTGLILVLGAYFIFTSKSQTIPQKATLPKAITESETIYETKTDNKGAVEIKVTPTNLSIDAEVKFEVVLDTHSVPLDFDIVKISKLTDDKNNSYQPISWSGGSGGHHLSGILIFPKNSKEAKSVTLVIMGIDNQDRTFQWDIKNHG